MDIAETLRRCEERLLDGPARKNAELVASMLTEDFQEFGSSGRIFSKQQIVAALQSEVSARIALRDFKVQILATDIALVTYRSSRNAPEAEAVESLRSSIWVRRQGEWQMLFHQGTRAAENHPVPLASATGANDHGERHAERP